VLFRSQRRRDHALVDEVADVGDLEGSHVLLDEQHGGALVEQNVGALEVADVGYFVDQGVVTATLRGKELADGERIRSLYLG